MRSLFTIALAMILMTGCSAPSSLPSALIYSPPGSDPTQTASIRGSQRSGGLLDAFTAFVALVDGKKVSAQRRGWSDELVLSPGQRIITVEFRRGPYGARTDLEIRVVSGALYEVQFDTDAGVVGRSSYCDFWIVDLGTGQPVTPIKRASLEGASSLYPLL